MGGGPSKDMQSMRSRDWSGEGQTAIVTGPMGAGIGFHTSRWLAERGCHVILAGRSAERLAECEKQIRAASKAADGTLLPPDQVKLTSIVLDLTSLASVESFSAQFAALNRPLNILINNAGVLDTPYSHTKDGIEMQIGTNHIGHFHLTHLLMPQLLAGAPSRVVNVASMAHKMASMTADSLADRNSLFHVPKEAYGGWKQYSNSKLANVLFARSLNARYAAQGVTAYSLHPGVVATEIGRQNKLNAFCYKIGSFAIKSAEEGAGTSIHCATSPDALKDAGAYFDVCAPSKGSAKATDDAMAERLWTITEEEIAAWKAKQGEAAPAAAAAAEEKAASA